jgi:hypothetical protein
MISQDEKLMIFAFPKLMGVIVAPVKRFAWNHRPLPHLRFGIAAPSISIFCAVCLRRPNPVQESTQGAHAG